MIKIAVIGGGFSSEREISLRSARNVYDALVRSGQDCEFIDLSGELDAGFIESIKIYDLILPILHGRGGEDGTIQSILDAANINYLGSGASASRIAFNKHEAKKHFQNEKLLVPKGMIVNKKNLDEFLLKFKKFVLKPINEGSSIGTYICRKGEPDILEINGLLELYVEMLGEELIEGVEITVPVLGDKALPPIAIIPPDKEEFDLENKYNGKTSEICPIPDDLLNKKIQHDAMRAAEVAHKCIGARHLSRTDMIIDGTGKVYILEINTIPGMTSQSLYPKSAAVAGIGFDELISKLVDYASGNN